MKQGQVLTGRSTGQELSAKHMPYTSPRHTCPNTWLLATPLSLPATAFLHGHTSYSRITEEPGCLAQTNAHMLLSGDPGATKHQQPGSSPPSKF